MKKIIKTLNVLKIDQAIVRFLKNNSGMKQNIAIAFCLLNIKCMSLSDFIANMYAIFDIRWWKY